MQAATGFGAGARERHVEAAGALVIGFPSRAPICIKLKNARDNRAEKRLLLWLAQIKAAPARDYFLSERSTDSGIEAIGNRYGPAQLSQYPITPSELTPGHPPPPGRCPTFLVIFNTITTLKRTPFKHRTALWSSRRNCSDLVFITPISAGLKKRLVSVKRPTHQTDLASASFRMSQHYVPDNLGV